MRAKFNKPDTCAGCALETKGFGFAPASGPSNADLLFVGEALGEQEAIFGAPFVGAAGAMLTKLCDMAGLDRTQVRIANVLSCQPPGNWLVGSPWEGVAIAACRQYLDPELNRPPSIVVPLGMTATRQILRLPEKGVSLEDFHGTVQRDPDNRFWVVPSFHPSYLLQGKQNLTGTAVWDLQQAMHVRTGTYRREDAELIIDPPPEYVDRWLTGVEQEPGAWMAVDIETPDKAGGRSEGELGAADQSYIIERVNLACHRGQGLTMPYYGPYRTLIDRALRHSGWKLMWNADYDTPRLVHAGHGIGGKIVDLMWLWHLLQSDLPRGLGFAAPFCSTFGAWKHLSKSDPGRYAAIDAVQTQRCGEQLIPDAWKSGMWDTFERHFQRLWDNVLVPARTIGVQVDRSKLDQFQTKLEATSVGLLAKIQATAGAGKLHPKHGYAEKPDGPPPDGILGKAKGKRGNKVKSDYLEGGVTLIEKLEIREIRWCKTCGAKEVTPKHKCKPIDSVTAILPGLAGTLTQDGFFPNPDPETRKSRAKKVKVWKIDAGQTLLAGDRPESIVVTEAATVSRWYWQLPFNPDTPAQILAYIKGQGHLPGKHKKTKKETTDRKTLERLARSTGDPLYKHLLDYKAVAKVHGTYVLGTRSRLDANDRLHPTPTFKPSTQRLSYVNPNITNVVGDKGGETLASGYRECIVAGPGNVLVELDFAGIEAVESGWFMGDPDYIRLARLGVHALVANELCVRSGLMSERANLTWSDADLGAFLKSIKGSSDQKIIEIYDRSKRCVHGNNYGLTTYGMVTQFPESFPNLKAAEEVQHIYYELAPKLQPWHGAIRALAHKQKYLGGPGAHPYGYKHWFYSVFSYQLIDERRYFGREKNGLPVTRINGRPFSITLGEDGKRCVAFFPQSTARGVLTEAMLRLFDPEIAEPYGSYIGDACDGVTPLRAPIHDSLLLEIPKRKVDRVVEIAVREMRRQIEAQPCPPEWGIGDYLSIGVDGKIGLDWKHTEKLKLPGGEPAGVASDLRMTSVLANDDPESNDAEDTGELDTEAVA